MAAGNVTPGDSSPGRAQRAPGLVSFKTSGTRNAETPTGEAFSGGEPFTVTKSDQRKMRLLRMKKNVLTTARLHQEELDQGNRRYQAAMVTLTYRPGQQWEKRHISDYLARVRKWCKRRGVQFRYDWVAEIQEKRFRTSGCDVREAVHYHVLIFLPKGLTLPKADKQGWWPYGMTRTERVKFSAIGYLAKYASKGTADDVPFPKGCRIHGAGGLSETSRNERAWWNCPAWVREKYSIEDRPRRAKGGGFVLKASGEWVPSPYLVFCVAGVVFVVPRPPPD